MDGVEYRFIINIGCCQILTLDNRVTANNSIIHNKKIIFEPFLACFTFLLRIVYCFGGKKSDLTTEPHLPWTTVYDIGNKYIIRLDGQK